MLAFLLIKHLENEPVFHCITLNDFFIVTTLYCDVMQ